LNAPAIKKPVTSPVPARAMLDTDLTHLDLRVLIKICAHDRMSLSKSGQGCLVSSKNIAVALGVHHTSASTSLTRLKDAGYIVHEKRSDGDKRGRTYRVIYTDADDLAVRNEGNAPPKSSLPLGETNSAKSFLQNGKVVSRDFENDDNFQCDATYKYKEGTNPKELGKNSDKSARFQRGMDFESKATTAEFLRHVESGLNAGSLGLGRDDLEYLADWLNQAFEHYFDDDPKIAFWSQRLSEHVTDSILNEEQALAN
jgi:hypothetical protein